MKPARKFLPNFCTIIILWWRCGLPLDSELDPSGISFLFAVPLPLSVFSTLLLPIFSALLFLPLCGLDTQDIPFLPAGEARFPSQCVFWLIAPRSTHHWSWKG